MGDEERATIGQHRRRSSPFGYPVQPVDPEATPPPMVMPLPHNERIPEPIAEQLGLLSDGLGTVTEALGKIWDARKDSGRINRLEGKIDSLAQDTVEHSTKLDEFVMPALKGQMARVDALLTFQEVSSSRLRTFFDNEWPRLEKTVESIEKALNDLLERIGRVERSQEKLNDNLMHHANRIALAESNAKALETRVNLLEIRNVESDAGDKRQRKLLGAAVAVLSALGAIAGWFVTKFLKL